MSSSFLSKIFGSKKPSSVVGIDIGASSAKVVQLKQSDGRIVLETYGAVALGPYADSAAGEIPPLTDEQLAAAVTEVIKDARVTTKTAVLSIPAKSSLVFVLELPTTDQSKLAALVPNEARKYIPVPMESVTFSWWPLPQGTATPSKVPKTQVLAAAIRNEITTTYGALAKNTALSVTNYEVEVFSALRASLGHELSPVALIDFGANSTRVALIEHGMVKKYRTINRGAFYLSQSVARSLQKPFTYAEQIKRKVGLEPDTDEESQKVAEILRIGVEYILTEINSSILEYQQDYHRIVDKVIVTGGGSLLRGLDTYMKERVHSNIIQANPFSKIQTPQFLEETLRVTGREFTIAVGAALSQFS